MAKPELDEDVIRASPAINSVASATNEDVSDPEEDDLDDLDDMLDEFSAVKSNAPRDHSQILDSQSTERIEGIKTPETAANDFSKQLQEQMAALMGSGDESPEMKQEIEAVMQELGTAADLGLSQYKSTPSKFSSKEEGRSSNGEEPFQQSIRKTMERMQASGAQATAAAESDESDDMLAQMLKDMQNGGIEGAGDEGFNKMLMGMMEQLTNKDILYEPMRELHDKFPAWMVKNKHVTAADDLKRYEEQQRLVSEIVARFETKGYSDSKSGDREFIVERMQQMQAAGNPPTDLVGDMSVAQNELGDINSGCAQQ